MADSYILFRQGKTPVGPFITIEAAANYIISKRLLGFAVLPMSRPELGGVAKKSQNVVGSGTLSDEDRKIIRAFMYHVRGQFGWNHQISMKENVRRFLTEILSQEPRAVRMKIPLIQESRQLVHNHHGGELSIPDAREVLDNHRLYQQLKSEDGE